MGCINQGLQICSDFVILGPVGRTFGEFITDGFLAAVLCCIDKHGSVSLRCSVHIVTSEDSINDTTLLRRDNFTSRIVIVQLHSGVATNISCNGIGTNGSLTTAKDITTGRTRSNGSTSQIDYSTFLDLTHLAAAIDATTDGGRIDESALTIISVLNVHLCPDGGSELRRVVFVSRSIAGSTNSTRECFREERSTRTTAGTIDAAIDSTTRDVDRITRIGFMMV